LELDAVAASETAVPAEAAKNPIRPAPVATNVVTHARLKKVCIVFVPFDVLTGFVLFCSCDVSSLRLEQAG
jgi:hypothetical protein